MAKKKSTFKRFGAVIEPMFEPGDVVTHYLTGKQIKILGIDPANGRYECTDILEQNKYRGHYYENIHILETYAFKFIPYHQIWRAINV